MDCSLPDSSVHGILQARILEWGYSLLQGIFLTQGSNSGLLNRRQILCHLGHQEALFQLKKKKPTIILGTGGIVVMKKEKSSSSRSVLSMDSTF